MRSSIIGSGLVHLVLLAALFIVRTSAPIIVPGPDVVQVALTDPASLQSFTPPPRTAEPKEEMTAPPVKPVEEEGVKIAPPKPAPKKKEEPKHESPPPTSMPQPALPYAQVGNAGLSGAVAVDARDFAFTYYLLLVRNKVAQAWTPPTGLSGGRIVRAVVYFRIGRDGGLSNIRLEESSGVDYFDRAAVRAVTLSDPLPPLPLGFPGGDLGVHFGFQYQQP